MIFTIYVIIKSIVRKGKYTSCNFYEKFILSLALLSSSSFLNKKGKGRKNIEQEEKRKLLQAAAYIEKEMLKELL